MRVRESRGTNARSIIVIDFPGYKDNRKINTMLFVRKSVSSKAGVFFLDRYFLPSSFSSSLNSMEYALNNSILIYIIWRVR